jgi:hypothetical protein
MAWAVVQSKRTGFSGSSPYTGSALGAFSTNPVVGNRIIVVTEQWEQSAGRPLATVSDSVNGSYTKHLSASIDDGGFLGEVAIHSVVVTSSASTNPTATFSASTAHGGIVAAVEVSGLGSVNGAGAVDVQASTGSGSGGTAASGATGATGSASEFALFIYGDDGWGVSMSSGQQGSGWTWLDGLSGGQTGSYLSAYKDSGASGSTVNGSMASGVPGGGTTWALAVAVFKVAGGGASPQTITAGAISTAESVYQPSILQTQLLTPNAIATGLVLYAPTVTLQVLPGTIATAESVYQPTIATSVVPGTIATAVVVYAPTVNVGAGQSVTPGAIASAEVVYGPTVTQSVLPGAITTAELVYSPTVALVSPQTIQPGTITTAEQVYAPVFVGFTFPDLQPGTIPTAAQVYAPVVVVVPRALAPPLEHSAALGAPELVLAGATGAPTLVTIFDSGAPSLVPVP